MAGTTNFQIDEVDMPKPHIYKTRPMILTRDSERLVGSGRLIAPYLGTVWETQWTYKKLRGSDYDTIYEAYILSCDTNKSIEHTLKTLDSNTGDVLTYRIYTQDDFDGGAIARMENGIRIYKNITFTFVGVGGGE